MKKLGNSLFVFAFAISNIPVAGQAPGQSGAAGAEQSNMIVPVPSSATQDSMISNLATISTNHPFFQTAAAFSEFGIHPRNPQLSFADKSLSGQRFGCVRIAPAHFQLRYRRASLR